MRGKRAKNNVFRERMKEAEYINVEVVNKYGQKKTIVRLKPTCGRYFYLVNKYEC